MATGLFELDSAGNPVKRITGQTDAEDIHINAFEAAAFQGAIVAKLQEIAGEPTATGEPCR